ncbi:MAG: peroxiredoxin [Betaproteobacteria bacterium]|nr:peroxiredoxin [Betaproteobacteria bacterium]
MLQIGSRAPVFELPDASMEMIQLSSFRGKKNVVLYFYPRDGTPGCTMEAIAYSDHDTEFAECDTVVFGVSRDDCLVHEEFRDKHGLSMQLLSDTDCEVMKKYEVMTEQAHNGSSHPCVHRSTFVIDKKGVVRHILRDINPREHAAAVLKLVRQIHGH